MWAAKAPVHRGEWESGFAPSVFSPLLRGERRGGSPLSASRCRLPASIIRTTAADATDRRVPEQSPAFEELDASDLEQLATEVEVEYFAAGEVIFEQGEAPMRHVRVVRSGAVELVDRGRVLDRLEEGELFGHPSMVSGLPTGLGARAADDVLSYRLPAASVVPLLGRPAGLRYLARSLLARPRPDVGALHAGHDPAQQPAVRLLHGQPVVCEPATTVRDAARRMAEAGASSALVRLGDERFGILTDHDLRERVVADGVPTEAPVTAAMSAPAFYVGQERLGAEIMLEMLDRGIRHVPVVSPFGEVLGVLTDVDLLATETRTPFSLRREIDAAATPQQLRRAAGRLRPAVIALHDARLPRRRSATSSRSSPTR